MDTNNCAEMSIETRVLKTTIISTLYKYGMYSLTIKSFLGARGYHFYMSTFFHFT